MAQSIIIIGVGPFVSLSLSKRLASLGWRIALISRSTEKLKMVVDASREAAGSDETCIVSTSADAGNPRQLCEALEWSSKQLGSVDCVLYNAARVGPNDLMTVDPQVLEQDFSSSAIGTLVTGQWFARYVEQHQPQAKGALREDSPTPFPLFLATAGLLHEKPLPSYASLSTVKSASYSLTVNFSQLLPEKYGIRVGAPIIVEPIIPKGDGTYATKSDPDVIVDKIMMPFLQWRGEREWVRDRVW